MSRLLPEIGRWYQELGSRQVFEIVALDREEGTVQIQYLDGEIADYDLEAWGELTLVGAAAPEDWRTAFELDDDVAMDPDAALQPPQWGNPLSRIEPETMLGIDDF